MTAVADEVDRNYEAFIALLPDILSRHRGQYALLHNQNIVTYFGNSLSAMVEGMRQFGDGRFSVQEVTTEKDNLGFYSYVGVSGQS